MSKQGFHARVFDDTWKNPPETGFDLGGGFSLKLTREPSVMSTRIDVEYEDSSPPKPKLLTLVTEATGIPDDVIAMLDKLKPTRVAYFYAPTAVQKTFDKPIPCFVVTHVGDREITVSLGTFYLMKPGVEYELGLGSDIVVRRDGNRLTGRKLEAFVKLSELE